MKVLHFRVECIFLAVNNLIKGGYSGFTSIQGTITVCKYLIIDVINPSGCNSINFLKLLSKNLNRIKGVTLQ